MKSTLEFTIDREEWARVAKGGSCPFGNSELLNKQGAMCCMGHYCRALGIPTSALHRICEPDSLADEFREVVARGPVPLLRSPVGGRYHSPACENLIDLNDRFENVKSISNIEQERRIAAVFAEFGVKVGFTGKQLRATG